MNEAKGDGLEARDDGKEEGASVNKGRMFGKSFSFSYSFS